MAKKKESNRASRVELIKTTHNGKPVIRQKMTQKATFAQQLQWIVMLGCVVIASFALILSKINEGTPSLSGSNAENIAPASVDAGESIISIDQPATASVTNTPGPTAYPTVEGVRQMEDTGVVTMSSVKVRQCAETSCQELGVMNNGDTFSITGRVIDGQDVAGNRLWYQISYFDKVGYVSATMVGIASEQPVAPVVVQPLEPISVAPVNQWNCAGNLYDCSDFSSREEVMSYFYACPGDPSRMDGDGDGIPCERNF